MEARALSGHGDDLRSRVLAKVAHRFELPLIENSLRAMYVEHLIEEVLGQAWEHTGADWGRCDFTSSDPHKIRLEVKQSAALQSWSPENPDAVVVPNPRFDIRERTGWYDGAIWHDDPGRSGEIFVFAWHPVTDRAVANHGDPLQWGFYVVLEDKLPSQKSIGLPGIAQRGRRATIDTLAAEVAQAAGHVLAVRAQPRSND